MSFFHQSIPGGGLGKAPVEEGEGKGEKLGEGSKVSSEPHDNKREREVLTQGGTRKTREVLSLNVRLRPGEGRI